MKKTKPTPALTNAERQREYEAKRKAQGWRRVQLWLAPRVDRAPVRAYAERKNREAGGVK